MRFLLFLTGEDSQVFFVYGGTRWRDLVTIFLYLAPDVLIAQALGFQPTRGAESYGACPRLDNGKPPHNEVDLDKHGWYLCARNQGTVVRRLGA